MIPSAIDAQEAVALKLLKRFLNLRYEGRTEKRPPSIYLAKRAGGIGYHSKGLSVQLFLLADSTAKLLRDHIKNGTRPNEKNPSYPADKINDRWPRPEAAGNRDMRLLEEQLEYLCERLEKMQIMSLADMAVAIDDLFGERVGKEQRAVLEKRYDRRKDKTPILSEGRTGAIKAPAIIMSNERYREVPTHNFHPFLLRGSKSE